MLRDGHGILWVSYSSGPLYRLAGTQWTRADEVANHARALTLAIASDHKGALWFAHPNNTVTITDSSGRPARRLAYDCVSCLNRGHMRWAWASLVWVAFSDLYVRLCAMGVWTDWRIL